jgi:hypothetical protein
VVLGVTIPDIQDFAPTPEGGTIKKKGYFKNEYPDILHTGVGFVELAEKIEAGSQVTSGDEGKAIKYVPPELKSRDPADIQSFVYGVRDAHLVIAGTVPDGGDAGDIVRIDLDRR